MGSKAFGVNVGKYSRILYTGLLNSLISELYSIVEDTSVDFSIDFNVSNVCFIRNCVCLALSKCSCKMSFVYIFTSLTLVFILLTILSSSLCHISPHLEISIVIFSYSLSTKASWFSSSNACFSYEGEIKFQTFPTHF